MVCLQSEWRLTYAIAARTPYLPSAAALSMRIVRFSLRLGMLYGYTRFEAATALFPKNYLNSACCSIILFKLP